MSRILLALLAVVALLAGTAWFALAACPVETPAAVRAPGSASAATASARQEAALVAPWEPASGSSEPAEADARAVALDALEEQLARALWVNGRVILPPGTPADEELTVTADGRDFADGSDHSARVAHDGSFRVAFSASSKRRRLRLQGHYLYLTESVSWRIDDPEPVTLEPRLGGRVVANLLAPAGLRTADLEGVVMAQLRVNSRGILIMDASTAHSLPIADRLDFGALEADREYRLSYRDAEYLAETDWFTVDAGRTTSVDLELRAGVMLSGHVRDEQGVGVAGVRVHAYVLDSGFEFGMSSSAMASTDAEGTFRLEALHAGTAHFSLDPEGYEPVELRLEDLSPAAPPAPLEFVLRRGSTISGSISWPDGSPARAQLELSSRLQGGSPEGFQHLQITSEADGGFLAAGLTAASYDLWAQAVKTVEVPEISQVTGRERMRKRRTQWSVQRAHVQAGSQAVALVLSPGESLVGRVLGQGGAPVDDFWVAAEHEDSGEVAFSTRTVPGRRFRDPDGRFELPGFQSGSWLVTLRAPGFARPEPWTVQFPGAEPVLLHLPREARVSGRVLDAEDAPVAEVLVELARTDRPGQRGIFDDDYSDLTGSDGRFHFDQLGPGGIALRATPTAGATSAPLELQLAAGQELEDLVLRLRPDCTLTCEVLDYRGRGEPDVTVWIQPDDDDELLSRLTDANGRFEARGLAPGEYQLHAQDSTGLLLMTTVVLREGQATHARLASPRTEPVRLHGRVSLAGEPCAGASVSARTASSADAVLVGSTRVSGADGAYELTLPGAGSYLIGAYLAEPDGLSWTTPVQAPEVAELELDLRIPVGHIRGRVRDASGAPLEGVTVHSEPKQHDGGPRGNARTGTDAEGRYQLALPPGLHDLLAGGDDRHVNRPGAGYCAVRVSDLRVVEGGLLEGVDFVLSPGGELDGSVLDPDGSRARGALLLDCGPAGARIIGSASTEGSFHLGSLPEGTLWLRAATEQAATPAPVAVAIQVGAPASVELQLAPATLVNVRVLDATGAPVGCEIEVRDRDGLLLPVHSSGEQGAARVGPLTAGRYVLRARREDRLAERALEIAGHEPPRELVITFD